MTKCPRCGTNPLNPKPARNAISRVDNLTAICSMCGTDEAIRRLVREPLWPNYPQPMKEVK